MAERGYPIDALAVLAAALRSSPRHPEGHALRLDLLRKVGPERDPEAWAQSLLALYERGEAEPANVLELALVEERLGRLEFALGRYEEVLALGAVRAAGPELVQMAHGGMLRCRAVIGEGEDEASASPAPSTSTADTPRKSAGGAQAAAAEPVERDSRKERALEGRGSMQLRSDDVAAPVEIPLAFVGGAAPDLLGRVSAGDLDSPEAYRLAEDVWSWGLDLLVRPGAEGLKAPNRQAAPLPAADPQLSAEARRIVAELSCRVLLCHAGAGRAEALAAEVIAAVARDGSLGVALVVAPGPLLSAWARRLRRALPGVPILEAAALSGAGTPQAPCVLLDDSTAPALFGTDPQPEPDLVVVDQAQQMASLESRLSRWLMDLAPPRLLLLSPVPVVSDLLSLHALVTLLRPGRLGTAGDFRAAHIVRSEPWRASSPATLLALLEDVLLFDGSGESSVAPPPAPELRRMARSLDPSGRAHGVAELLGWEPPPGRVATRDPRLAAALKSALRDAPGWTVSCDAAPPDPEGPTPALVVHVDLPIHPAQLSLRREGAGPGTREWLLLEEGSPDLMLWLACGAALRGPRPGDPAAVQRMMLRSRDDRSPLTRVLQALADAPSSTAAELEAVTADLEQAASRSRRSEEHSAALLAGGEGS